MLLVLFQDSLLTYQSARKNGKTFKNRIVLTDLGKHLVFSVQGTDMEVEM